MSKPHRSEMFAKTGHAPGHLRECLLNALEHGENWINNLEMDFLRKRHQRWWDEASPTERARWLLGQLWSCNDIVPSLARSDVRDWLDQDREHFSFASLARALKMDLDARFGGTTLEKAGYLSSAESFEVSVGGSPRKIKLPVKTETFTIPVPSYYQEIEREERRLLEREEQRLLDREDRKEQEKVDREEQRFQQVMERKR